MTVQDLFRQAKLAEAIQALGNELRDQPTDVRRRTFLFELLCFAGDFGRAEKQLNVLSDSSPEAEIGALLCRSALSAERKRQLFFEAKQYLTGDPLANDPRPGTLNDEPFQTIEDVDPRIGPRLEIFLAGEYVRVPFAHIGSLNMQQPGQLRDLLWSSAAVEAGPSLKGQDFGDVLLPVLYPYSWQHARDTVKLGRETDWLPDPDQTGDIPFGQKMLLLDGEREIPILEIRSLQFHDAAAAATPA
jgi:type VI secretion system protein ImpE